MTTTAKSQPHFIFSKISTVFIFDWIFWAVHAALLLHIHKKKALIMFLRGEITYNKATIKEVVRLYLKSSPRTMSALGVVTSLKLPSWANICHSPPQHNAFQRYAPSETPPPVAEAESLKSQQSRPLKHCTLRQPDNREGGFKPAKVVER